MARRRTPAQLRGDAETLRDDAAAETTLERRHLELLAEMLEDRADTLEALDQLLEAFTTKAPTASQRRNQ